MKRLLDIVLALLGLLVLGPLIAVFALLIWMQDRQNPFYVAQRIGRDEKPFAMIKLRSMVVNAEASGVDSTSASDARITPVGHVIRRLKLDELTQLLNVMRGDMSLVGPRPNVERETRNYTVVEKRLLAVRPGITDLASIVFADEGDILDGADDPDLRYNQVIRPWKSRLALIYVDKPSLRLYSEIVGLTAVAAIKRQSALSRVSEIVRRATGDESLAHLALRTGNLEPAPPPGSTQVVNHRD